MFKTESEAMLRCARTLFDEEITEGQLDGNKMIEAIESEYDINF